MIKEEDPRFKNLERKIGIFVLSAIAAVILISLLYAFEKDLFTHTYRVKFTADRGTGFSKGMPVKLSGFRIGRVTEIALNEQAMVDISLEIDKKYEKWIHSDSSAKLVKEGLVGENIVEISVGSMNKPVIKNSESITYLKTKGLDEIADEIAEKVKPVLIEVKDIISYINNPEGDLKQSVRNIELLTRNLEETRGEFNDLILNTGREINSIGKNTDKFLATADAKVKEIELKPSIDKLNSTLNTIDAKLPPVIEKLDANLANLNSVTADTKELTKTAFPKIPAMLSQTEDVIFKTDKLIDSLQNTWLLRDNSTTVKRKPFLKGDSYE